ncbi:MAG: hypothetical protein LC657_04355, partial [Desulfobacteraceae bacterium]|nr:hypothetical protein [Desulfobacteraceae bacterium]
MNISRCDKINAFFATFTGPCRWSCRSWAVTAFTAGFLLFCLPGLCMADAPVPPSQKNKDHIQYETQVAFITEQIGQIQKDLDWLRLKVKRMQDFDRFVPQRMHDSIAFKQSKITSLEKLKNRYQELLPKTLKKTPPPGKDTRTAARQQPGETPENGENLTTGDVSSPDGMFRQNMEKKLAATGLDNWLELVPNTTPVCLETRLPILFASASAEIPKGYDAFFK